MSLELLPKSFLLYLKPTVLSQVLQSWATLVFLLLFLFSFNSYPRLKVPATHIRWGAGFSVIHGKTKDYKTIMKERHSVMPGLEEQNT